MNVELVHRPGNTAAKINLNPGESMTAQAGAMIAMSGDMQIETTTHKKGEGGFLKAMKRLLGGESFFMNHYTPGSNGGHVYVAPTLNGDMQDYDLNGDTLVVQSGSFLAADHNVDIDVGWQGFKNLFSGESLFWLKMSGTGKVVFNAFGNIYPVDIDGEYIVDTGHIVAFQETLNYTVTKVAEGWVSSFMSGEGLICKFSGQGRVWVQSHNPSSFGQSLTPFLKPRRA